MISLIIPTYNRPQFLRRSLRYYRQERFTHKLTVADSSSPAVAAANAEQVASVKDVLEIDHLVYPSTTPFNAKLIQALEAIDTKYIAFCGDDDFITPKGIEQAAAYLEAHDDYSIASGHVSVITAHADTNGDPRYGLRSSAYSQRTIDDDDAASRLRDHLANYSTTFYSLHRRFQLICNMRQTHEATRDYRFGELLPSCLSLIQGKAICLDVLYMVRQMITDSTAGKTSSWTDLLSEDDYPERYNLFRNCLAKALENVVHLDQQDATEAVTKAFRAYLSHAVGESSTANGSLENPSSSGTASYRQLPERLKRVMRTLPEAARAAFIDAQALAMVRAPREAYRQLQRKRDEMSIDALLDKRSRFYADFFPVYESLGRYPDGIGAPLSQSCVRTIES
jgi:glycosyltransferase domain-containing protein